MAPIRSYHSHTKYSFSFDMPYIYMYNDEIMIIYYYCIMMINDEEILLYDNE